MSNKERFEIRIGGSGYLFISGKTRILHANEHTVDKPLPEPIGQAEISYLGTFMNNIEIMNWLWNADRFALFFLIQSTHWNAVKKFMAQEMAEGV